VKNVTVIKHALEMYKCHLPGPGDAGGQLLGV
jgi:hypothetical protein